MNPYAVEAVERGWQELETYFVDKLFWWRDIDLVNLDMVYFNTCVLGQLFGDYSTGLSRLGFAGEGQNRLAIRHGYIQGDSFNAEELKEAWIRKINEAEAKLATVDNAANIPSETVTVHILTVDGEVVRATRDERKFDAWVEILQEVGVDYGYKTEEV